MAISKLVALAIIGTGSVAGMFSGFEHAPEHNAAATTCNTVQLTLRDLAGELAVPPNGGKPRFDSHACYVLTGSPTLSFRDLGSR